MKKTTGVMAVFFLVMAANPAEAGDGTLSDSQILSLDYNLADQYSPPPTATIVSEQDMPGLGVEFTIHFPSTGFPDYFFYDVSDSSDGAGTLTGLNFGGYSNFDLKFTLVSVDGSTSASQEFNVGAMVGPYETYQFAYRPVALSLGGSYPASGISSTQLTSAALDIVGFTAYIPSGQGWSAGSHNVTFLVQPADGAAVIPEPATWTLVALGGLAMGLTRRRSP